MVNEQRKWSGGGAQNINRSKVPTIWRSWCWIMRQNPGGVASVPHLLSRRESHLLTRWNITKMGWFHFGSNCLVSWLRRKEIWLLPVYLVKHETTKHTVYSIYLRYCPWISCAMLWFYFFWKMTVNILNKMDPFHARKWFYVFSP